MAEWSPGQASTGLIEAADRALLYGKQDGGRGAVTPAPDLPRAFRPGTASARRSTRPRPPRPRPVAGTAAAQTERLRRRSRQLSLANPLGIRLAGDDRPRSPSLETAAEELHHAFGYSLCAWSRIATTARTLAAATARPVRLADGLDPAARPGAIGRGLRERRPVIESDLAGTPTRARRDR